MDDVVRFIGLPFDDSRPASAPDDLLRLAKALQDSGFAVSEPLPLENRSWSTDGGQSTTFEVWCEGFDSTVIMEEDWVVQVVTDVHLVNVVGDDGASRRGIDLLARLIGTVTQAADSYLGFVSNKGEELYFLGEDRPVQITEPMALFYFGRRFFDDWGTWPAFAADAELNVRLPNGQLVIPSLKDLT